MSNQTIPSSDLERINDERMATGLEAVPTEPNTWDWKEELQRIKELEACLDEASNCLSEAFMCDLTPDEIDSIEEASNLVGHILHNISIEILTFIDDHLDEIRSIPLTDVDECADALELLGSHEIMRQIITNKLRVLTGNE